MIPYCCYLYWDLIPVVSWAYLSCFILGPRPSTFHLDVGLRNSEKWPRAWVALSWANWASFPGIKYWWSDMSLRWWRRLAHCRLAEECFGGKENWFHRVTYTYRFMVWKADLRKMVKRGIVTWIVSLKSCKRTYKRILFLPPQMVDLWDFWNCNEWLVKEPSKIIWPCPLIFGARVAELMVEIIIIFTIFISLDYNLPSTNSHCIGRVWNLVE